MTADRTTFHESWYRVAGLHPSLRTTVQTRRQHFRGRRWHVVQDASNNQTVPQYFAQEYGISSYLGVPIRLGEGVIGSLCVLDTDSREFSVQERADLEKLATPVEERVRALTEQRRQARMMLRRLTSRTSPMEMPTAHHW